MPHPYIPNSVTKTKAEMLREVGATDAEQLYSKMIPNHLLLKRRLELPEPIFSEFDLKNYVKKILSKNIDNREYLSFLGGGCWNHFIPKICDEIANRSEFLTAYAGGYYSDVGRFQANWEFQSLICELVGMEVSGIPTYDWGSSAGNAIRMATRITQRNEVLVPASMSPARLSIIMNFCNLTDMHGSINVVKVGYSLENGTLDLSDLKKKMTSKTACVYFENPGYLGIIEDQGREISKIAQDTGAQVIVGVDPISLGVLAPPSEYGADIVCGDIQPLGIHMSAGGGLGGFIASRDEEKYVSEYPLRLISITDTIVPGEYGFGQAAYHRTSYMSREKAKDWVGTTAALHGIIAAVYLSVMGPEGLKEVGETILQKSHYTARKLEKLEGVDVRFSNFFKEFPLTVDSSNKSIRDINQKLLKKRIIGGKDISKEFPELGESALLCITELHSKDDIDRLVNTLNEVIN